MASKPPCLGCGDRCIGCHAWCMDYKSYVAERELITKNKIAAGDQISGLIDSIERMKKRRKGRY